MTPLVRILLGVALMPFGFASASHAQDANSAFVVTYIEVAPAAKRTAVDLLRELGIASRKDPNSLRFEVVQRIDRPNHFAVLELWKDQKAQEIHAAATKQFREKMQPLLSAPYDERPHGALAVGPGGNVAKNAIYAVTHVDIIPPKKDDGIAMTKQLADPSRKESGNFRYDVLQQTSRPNHMTLVEVWSGQKALEGHETSAHIKKYRDALLPMSGSLYDQRLYKALR